MINLRKIVLTLAVTTLTCLVSGCNSNLITYSETELVQAIRDRANDNINLAANLRDINAISDSIYSQIVENINRQADTYIDGLGNLSYRNDNATRSLQNAASRFHIVGGDGTTLREITVIDSGESKTASLNEDTQKFETDDNEVKVSNSVSSLKDHIISNYLLDARGRLGGKSEGVYTAEELGMDVFPIQFFNMPGGNNSEVENALNDISRCKLYVLRTDAIQRNGDNSLDAILSLVSSAVGYSSQNTDDGNTQAVGILDGLFMPAVDQEGNEVYMLEDIEDLICVSKSQGENAVNEPGKDLRIKQYNIDDAIDLRFVEFNKDAYRQLSGELGLDSRKIHLIKCDGEWRAYLMEYPVHSLYSLKMSEARNSGHDMVEATLKKSGIGVNLKTGKLVKYRYDTSTGKFNDGVSEDIDTENSYLTIRGASNENEQSLSSFVISGYSTAKVDDSSGEEHEVTCGRIILRDYLEATFAPGYDTGDSGKLVLFGRKIRLNMGASNFYSNESDSVTINNVDIPQTRLIYERGTTVASFIDINGSTIPNSPNLEITDFCDAEALNRAITSNCEVKRLPYINEEIGYNNGTVGDSDIVDISELSRSNSMNSIYPTMWFPSYNLGVTDYNTDSSMKQRFYCIATTKGIFQSSLYSSWINSEVPEASLSWWTEYLHNNDFKYSIDVASLEQYLTGNYRYELTQNGAIILDLQTVGKIQEIFDNQDDNKRIKFVKTTFIIVGWVMISMSFMLVLLWVLDTNTDIGVSLLEKVTLGKWVAVKYESDVPSHNSSGQKYITFKGIISKCAIFIVVGIILVRINVFSIASMLIDRFGHIASEIEKIIKGIR